MPKIEKITKQTENPYVNLYLVEGKNKVDHLFRYYQRHGLPIGNRLSLFLFVTYGNDYRYTIIPCRISWRINFA